MPTRSICGCFQLHLLHSSDMFGCFVHGVLRAGFGVSMALSSKLHAINDLMNVARI